MNQGRAMLRAVVGSGRWRRYLGFAIVFAVACALLSWWQFSRGQETSTANRLIARNWSAAPLTGATADRAIERWDAAESWRPVRLTGVYLADRTLLVRNRPSPQDGSAGYEVLVPLREADGTVFVVDRGWIPAAFSGALPKPPAAPVGRVTVTARLVRGEQDYSGPTVQDGSIRWINLPRIAGALGTATGRGAYGWLAAESPAVSGTPQALQAPSFDTGMHLSYAIQWILFALIGFGALAWSVRRDLRDAGEESVLAADLRAAARRRGRTPSDEAVEDSLVG